MLITIFRKKEVTILMNRAIVMKPKDNVATVVEQVEAGSDVCFEINDEPIVLKITGVIPSGHKFAIKDIAIGQQVIKYGERIGVTTKSIAAGEHVHVHNVESCRGRGDK
jgi:altronate dehydratase small subunit